MGNGDSGIYGQSQGCLMRPDWALQGRVKLQGFLVVQLCHKARHQVLVEVFNMAVSHRFSMRNLVRNRCLQKVSIGFSLH